MRGTFLLLLTTISLITTSLPTKAAKRDNKKAVALIKNKDIAPGGLIQAIAQWNPAGQQDFSSMCLDAEGLPAIVFIGHDGIRDSLKIARLRDGVLAKTDQIPTTGDLYQPTLSLNADKRLVCTWSELLDGRWILQSSLVDKPTVKEVLNDKSGNAVFAHSRADSKGRVHTVWQDFDGGFAEIRYRGPNSEGSPVTIAEHVAGDWEPRLTIGANDEALIVFDSYRNGNYDLFLARVSTAGKIRLVPLATSPRYEARGSGDVSPDGKSLWVAYEEGVERWGKDLGAEWRKKGGGLNYDRRLKVLRLNLQTETVERIADLTPLIPGMVTKPGSVGSSAINLPELVVDHDGRPWVFFRYCPDRGAGFWQLAVTRLDQGTWAQARTFENSPYCQDRRCSAAVSKDGSIYAAWPGDNRHDKNQGDSGIYLAKLDPNEGTKSAGPMPFEIADHPGIRFEAPNDTPERDRNEHHQWKINGEALTLYWGDVHRHTDFSNCRTTDDGCIVEHFRYAIDAGGLDYLATSDHTEVGKTYSPYEWFQSQKLADIFQNQQFFLSLYAYEREQRWPYGHRNIVFEKRGGPLVYISRRNYEISPWATPLPPQDGARIGEIPPWQLWDLLRAHGQRCVTIEHTSAGTMGTDWSVYDKIDHQFENIVEVFQGSRESYEGVGAPQPRVVTDTKSQFGKFSAGTWQNALRLGHRLGAYASSDHRSVHISYGGTYVKEFTRKGILDAMDRRLTVAATDKIFMEFSCNGMPLGSEITTAENPRLAWHVDGTAPISCITLIRNEKDYQIFEPNTRTSSSNWTDPEPLPGSNRYYLRVEQSDGNMGWTSPVWVNLNR
ncbi:MAG: hypothetical protein ISQ14_04535 [Verrucomicrobiae bacterium]|nr:hypothetical protein [Verrucomicrobiae bacterium]